MCTSFSKMASLFVLVLCIKNVKVDDTVFYSKIGETDTDGPYINIVNIDTLSTLPPPLNLLLRAAR